ncbi:alpha/beta fold hydrolase [Streptomyces sp. NPDC020719]|uniref:alpha/beta fold hydrolase n=1 Tax=unclassified Streptomyces TaxID=2593676 RepID=UPI0033F5B4D1
MTTPPATFASPLLVPLGRGTGDAHTVLLPAAGGGFSPYYSLAGGLTHRGPVHAIRAMGLMPGEEPDRDVPTMVERYLDLINSLPTKPSYLVGWSLGGVLAWELAARLAHQGDAAPAVVMVDSYARLADREGATRDEVLDRIGRSMGFEPTWDQAPRVREVAAAHLDAAHAHLASAGCEPPALLLSCTAGRGADQLDQWALRAPNLRVREVDCDHFEVLDAARTPTLLRHIDDFLTALDQGSYGTFAG